MSDSRGHQMFPTAVPTGTFISAPIHMELPFNAVVLELNGRGSVTATVLDSSSPSAAFTTAFDTSSTNAMTGVGAYYKTVIVDVLEYIEVKLVVISGLWNCTITPIVATNQATLTITANSSQNLNQYAGTAVGPTNPIDVQERRPATPALTAVAVTNVSTAILATNAARLGGTIYNEGAAICYAALGSTASLTAYAIQIASGGYYEFPYGYTGAVAGITSSGTAQLRVSELTA